MRKIRLASAVCAVESQAERDLLGRAAGGEPTALELLLETESQRIHAMQRTGSATFGAFGLTRMDAARALARCTDAIVRMEGDEPRNALERVVLADAWFAEALRLGREDAWIRFEGIVSAAVRSLGSESRSLLGRLALKDVEDAALGAFYLDGRIASFRATAPIGAWVRQVVFNLWRAQLARRKDPRTGVPLSQLASEEGSADDLLPPARDLDPAECASREEWDRILARVVPEALAQLDRDERRMLAVLPGRQLTQVALAEELGISPFKINRWYKDVRERFLRAVRRGLQLEVHLSELQADRLVAWLAGLDLVGTPEPAGTENLQSRASC